MSLPQAQDLIAVGKCLKPHGIRGELKVAILTDFPERFEQTDSVYLQLDEVVFEKSVEATRFHGGCVLVKLSGVDSIDQAEQWRNAILSITADQLMELEEDEYWHFELEGLEVLDPTGQRIGRLKEVLRTPGHDLYSVEGSEGEILIPAVKEYILAVDLKSGQVTARLPQ